MHTVTNLEQSITMKLPEDSFRAHNCEKPSLEVQVTKDELLTMYREMQTIRRLEIAAEALYKADLVRGYCHLAIGQVSLLALMLVTSPDLFLSGSRLDRHRTRDRKERPRHHRLPLPRVRPPARRDAQGNRR